MILRLLTLILVLLISECGFGQVWPEGMFFANYRENGRVKHSVSEDGKVFLIGEFEKKIEIKQTKIQSKGESDIFLMELDSNLKMKKILGIGSAKEDRIGSIAYSEIDSSIVVSGSFEDSLVLGTNVLRSIGGSDFFVAKFDKNFNVKWAKTMGSLDNDFGHDVGIDGKGTIVLTGRFSEYGKPLITEDTTIDTYGDSDLFVATYTSDGKPIWIEPLGSRGSDNINGSIILDKQNNIVIGVNFSSRVYWKGEKVFDEIGSGGAVFCIETSTGKMLQQVLGYNIDFGVFNFTSYGVDSFGAFYVSGEFDIAKKIKFGSKVYTLPTNSSSHNSFLAKWSNDGGVDWIDFYEQRGRVNNLLVSNINKVYLSGYLKGENGESVNIIGIDSNNQLNFAGSTGLGYITSLSNFNQYKILVSGTTGPGIMDFDSCFDLFPTEDHNYFVAIAKPDEYLGKPDSTLSAKSISSESTHIKLMPNPVLDVLDITSNFSGDIVEFRIYNSIGELIIKEEHIGPRLSITTTNWPSGIYYVYVSSGNGIETKSFIKK